jgi:hypothetical protein
MVKVTISVPEELRVKMIQFEIYPSTVARKAFEQEVRLREELAKLAKAKEKDPRVTPYDLRKGSKRISRLMEE